MMLTEGAIVGVWVQGSKRIIILHKCIDRRVGVGRRRRGLGLLRAKERQWGGRKEYQRARKEREGFCRSRKGLRSEARMSEGMVGGKGGALGVGWGGGGQIRLGTKD